MLKYTFRHSTQLPASFLPQRWKKQLGLLGREEGAYNKDLNMTTRQGHRKAKPTPSLCRTLQKACCRQ